MPVVHLTFDVEFPDQPAADPLGSFDKSLAILSEHHIHATCFVLGAWAAANPARVAAIQKAEHQIGIHAHSHADLSQLDAGKVIAELNQAHDVLATLGQETRPWFRAPYGHAHSNAFDMDAAFDAAGYRHITWHAHGDDWRPEWTVDQIVQKTMNEVKSRWPEPAIVLFHSWPNLMPIALTHVIKELQELGAEFEILQ